MGIIAKSYNITHIDGLVIKTSSWRRPFDDLYNELNGNLDSANLVSGFTFNASQVDYSSTAGFFSATSLDNHIRELLPPGFHDMHFFAYGTRLSIFPGRAEVNGMMARVKQRLDIDLTSIAFISGSLVGNTLYGVFINPEANLTASDIFLAGVSGGGTAAITNLIGSPKLGLYHSSIATGKRGIYSFKYLNNSQAVDHEFLTPPVTSHSYDLTRSEALAHPLFATGMESSTGLTSLDKGFVSGVLRLFNMNTWRYEWELAGRGGNDSCATQLILIDNISQGVGEKYYLKGTFWRKSSEQRFHHNNLEDNGESSVINIILGCSTLTFDNLIVSSTYADVIFHMGIGDKLSKEKLTDG